MKLASKQIRKREKERVCRSKGCHEEDILLADPVYPTHVRLCLSTLMKGRVTTRCWGRMLLRAVVRVLTCVRDSV